MFIPCFLKTDAMTRRGSGIAVIVPGTMGRLAVHGGTIPALQKIIDDLNKHINMIVTTSAGSIATAALLGGSPEKFRNSLISLKVNQIYTIEPSLRYSGKWFLATLAFTALVLMSQHYMIWWLAAIFSSLVAAFFATSGIVFRRSIRNMRAPLDTKPLHKLLKDNIDFHKLFTSPVELKVLAVNIETGRPEVFSSKDYGKHDPDNPEHCERFINILRASSALLLFPWVEVDGKCLGDGEFWTDFPIEETLGYRKVICLEYWHPGAGLRPARRPRGYIEYVMRVFDIMRDLFGQQKRSGLRNQWNNEWPDVLRIHASDELMKDKPEISLTKFDPVTMRKAIEFGEKIIEENRDRIIRFLMY